MQAISTGEVELEQLSQEISDRSSLSRADVHAVLISLGELMLAHLAEGKTVSIDNIGRFKIGFKSGSKPSPDLLRPKKVSRFHINYQPTLKLKRWLKIGFEVRKEQKG